MAITEDQQGIEGGAEEWKRELYDATPEREGELSSTISGAVGRCARSRAYP